MGFWKNYLDGKKKKDAGFVELEKWEDLQANYKGKWRDNIDLRRQVRRERGIRKEIVNELEKKHEEEANRLRGENEVLQGNYEKQQELLGKSIEKIGELEGKLEDIERVNVESAAHHDAVEYASKKRHMGKVKRRLLRTFGLGETGLHLIVDRSELLTKIMNPYGLKALGRKFEDVRNIPVVNVFDPTYKTMIGDAMQNMMNPPQYMEEFLREGNTIPSFEFSAPVLHIIEGQKAYVLYDFLVGVPRISRDLVECFEFRGTNGGKYTQHNDGLVDDVFWKNNVGYHLVPPKKKENPGVEILPQPSVS